MVQLIAGSTSAVGWRQVTEPIVTATFVKAVVTGLLSVYVPVPPVVPDA